MKSELINTENRFVVMGVIGRGNGSKVVKRHKLPVIE